MLTTRPLSLPQSINEARALVERACALATCETQQALLVQACSRLQQAGVEATAATMRGIGDATSALTATALDEQEQFRQLAANIPQVFWVFDQKQSKTLYISPACETLLGVSADELRLNPRALISTIHKEDRRRVYEARRDARFRNYDETFRIVRGDGTIRWVHDRAFPIQHDSQSVYRLAGIAEDVTERKEAEARLTQLAHFDILTALPNRALLHERLRQSMQEAQRGGYITAVMFIDVDRFKYVNDTLGHDSGDSLLKQIGARIVDCIRLDDTVGRLGGDEFAVVLNRVKTADDAAAIAAKILAALHRPFVIQGIEVLVSGSIGISLSTEDVSSHKDLLKNADTAMYRAKELGRNTFQFYKPEMSAAATEAIKLESRLRRALDNGEFVIEYQPKLSLTGRKVVGAEALLRWQHPDRGLLLPSIFMPVLEESGLIVQVGEWVMAEVCRQIGCWRRDGVPVVPIAINLSARQLLSPDLACSVQQRLTRQEIPPSLIQFEITETSVMKNPDEAIRTLEFLSSLGVGLAIDDFGTGYSSLAYLKRLPVETLKIDRSFIRDIPDDPDDVTITLAVMSMSRSLGLNVVAEGVENHAQLNFLAENGCDEVQGFLFSRPLVADDFVKFYQGMQSEPAPTLCH